jgi:hypothetical protein
MRNTRTSLFILKDHDGEYSVKLKRSDADRWRQDKELIKELIGSLKDSQYAEWNEVYKRPNIIHRLFFFQHINKVVAGIATPTYDS